MDRTVRFSLENVEICSFIWDFNNWARIASNRTLDFTLSLCVFLLFCQNIVRVSVCVCVCVLDRSEENTDVLIQF